MLRGVAGSFDFINAYSDAKGWVRFLPNFRIRPVIGFLCSVDHRVEGRVDLPALNDIKCLLVDFVADAVRIRSGSRNEEVKRLGSGIARPLRHDIV